MRHHYAPNRASRGGYGAARTAAEKIPPPHAAYNEPTRGTVYDRDARLDVVCWCGRTVAKIPAAEVRACRTFSCGDGCEDSDR